MPEQAPEHIRKLGVIVPHVTDTALTDLLAAIVAFREKARDRLRELASAHDLAVTADCLCHFCVLVRRIRPHAAALQEDWEREEGTP